MKQKRQVKSVILETIKKQKMLSAGILTAVIGAVVAAGRTDYPYRVFGTDAEILYRLCDECYYRKSFAGCPRWLKTGAAKNFI